MTYSEMTDDQRLEWGREELAARKADLSLRTAEGLRDAKQRADARRRAIGASKSAAASMVAEATRELRWAAYRTTASQPDAAIPCSSCGQPATAHAVQNGGYVCPPNQPAAALRDPDAELREFAGFLTAYLPELHAFEVPRMLDAIAAFRAADNSPAAHEPTP